MSKEIAEEIRLARSIAEHMAFLGGPDLRSMTDVELVAHIRAVHFRAATAIRACSISAHQAAEAFNKLAKV